MWISPVTWPNRLPSNKANDLLEKVIGANWRLRFEEQRSLYRAYHKGRPYTDIAHTHHAPGVAT